MDADRQRRLPTVTPGGYRRRPARIEVVMLETRHQKEAIAELMAGLPVRYRGVEVPAPPEDQRTARKARAWLLSHVDAAGASIAGRPPIDGLGARARPELTDAQVRAVDALASEWGVSRSEAARRVVDAGLEAVKRQE